ncbi:DsbA family oxidoreductase [Bacillus kwashiorkori]|uniref:DsbA family oxidoreductase n=1 Tax=Bacillus kwashiorkori TaxID=1522318 RepID=UPI0007820E7F|nr:DsbA family oxidoreductase [Bacillus kwashiorkori]
MKIEIWSDFACPFCYIGKRRLEIALNNFPHKDNVKIIYKSFELDPNTSLSTDKNIHEIIAGKYGMSVEEAQQANQNIIDQAKEVGLNYDFENLKPTNTFSAHRLAKFAETKGLLAEMTERLLQAYFIEGKIISDHDTLAELASEVGLDKEEVVDVLGSNQYSEIVRGEEREASSLGVQGVPFFVINRKYAVSGAQHPKVFLDTLNKIWEEENKKSPLQTLTPDNSGTTCSTDGCEIPRK